MSHEGPGPTVPGWGEGAATGMVTVVASRVTAEVIAGGGGCVLVLGDQGSSSGRVLTIMAGADTGSAGRGGNFGTARNG
ncbi:hypothetical protein [Actinokineospora diospyrosa]|uniref:hypothetical protein n=1 Tax=Actinokineospora diospyrosa TaxID=103728 RepID=UPI0020A5CA01|nr:hypothetical protein [Actinokineospora diospyrosa]